MRWVVVALIALHGLIHFLGFAKAYGLAELPELGLPVSRAMGLAWLAAGLLALGTAAALAAGARAWWVPGFAAAVLSQVVILAAWSDARWGTIANVVLLAAATYGLASLGPPSFSAAYRSAVARRLANPPPEPPPVTEADLEALPDPVRRYLRVTGAVGRPRIQRIRVTWRGRIRTTADQPWMAFTAEQHNFFDEPSRFFLLQATRSGLPVDVYHPFEGGSARMRVRLASLIPLADAGGAEFDRAETVTLLNDICLLAPGALLDPRLRWEPVDDRSARVHYTAGAHTVSAVLAFDAAGQLVDFVSDDRLYAAPGGALAPVRWSTPVGEYRSFGPRRVIGRGEGRWHPPEGAFAYIELELLDYEVNGSR